MDTHSANASKYTATLSQLLEENELLLKEREQYNQKSQQELAKLLAFNKQLHIKNEDLATEVSKLRIRADRTPNMTSEDFTICGDHTALLNNSVSTSHSSDTLNQYKRQSPPQKVVAVRNSCANSDEDDHHDNNNCGNSNSSGNNASHGSHSHSNNHDDSTSSISDELTLLLNENTELSQIHNIVYSLRSQLSESNSHRKIMEQRNQQLTANHRLEQQQAETHYNASLNIRNASIKELATQLQQQQSNNDLAIVGRKVFELKLALQSNNSSGSNKSGTTTVREYSSWQEVEKDLMTLISLAPTFKSSNTSSNNTSTPFSPNKATPSKTGDKTAIFQVAALNAQVQELEAESDHQRSEIVALKSQLSTVQDEKVALKSEIDTLLREQNDLCGHFDQEQHELTTSYYENLTAANTRIEQLHADVAALQAANYELAQRDRRNSFRQQNSGGLESEQTENSTGFSVDDVNSSYFSSPSSTPGRSGTATLSAEKQAVAKLATTSARVSELEATVDKLQAELCKMKQSAASTSSNNNDNIVSHRPIPVETLSQLEAAVSAYCSSLETHTQHELDDHADRIDELQQKINGIYKAFRKRNVAMINHNNTKLSELNSTIAALKQSEMELRNKLTDTERKSTMKTTSSAQRIAELEALLERNSKQSESEIKRQTAQIDRTYLIKFSAQSNRIEELELDNTELNSRVAALQQRAERSNQAAQAKVKELHDKKEVAQQQAAALQQKLSIAEERVQQIDAQDKMLEELQQQRLQLGVELEQLRNDADKQLKMRLAERDKLNAIKLSTAHARIMELEEQLEQSQLHSQQTLADKTHTLAELKAKHDELQALVQQLQRENDSLVSAAATTVEARDNGNKVDIYQSMATDYSCNNHAALPELLESQQINLQFSDLVTDFYTDFVQLMNDMIARSNFRNKVGIADQQSPNTTLLAMETNVDEVNLKRFEHHVSELKSALTERQNKINDIIVQIKDNESKQNALHLSSQQEKLTNYLSVKTKLDTEIYRVKSDNEQCIADFKAIRRTIAENEKKVTDLTDLTEFSRNNLAAAQQTVARLEDELADARDNNIILSNNQLAFMHKELDENRNSVVLLTNEIGEIDMLIEMKKKELRQNVARKTELESRIMGHKERILENANDVGKFMAKIDKTKAAIVETKQQHYALGTVITELKNSLYSQEKEFSPLQIEYNSAKKQLKQMLRDKDSGTKDVNKSLNYSRSSNGTLLEISVDDQTDPEQFNDTPHSPVKMALQAVNYATDGAVTSSSAESAATAPLQARPFSTVELNALFEECQTNMTLLKMKFTESFDKILFRDKPQHSPCGDAQNAGSSWMLLQVDRLNNENEKLTAENKRLRKELYTKMQKAIKLKDSILDAKRKIQRRFERIKEMERVLKEYKQKVDAHKAKKERSLSAFVFRSSNRNNSKADVLGDDNHLSTYLDYLDQKKYHHHNSGNAASIFSMGAKAPSEKQVGSNQNSSFLSRSFSFGSQFGSSSTFGSLAFDEQSFTDKFDDFAHFDVGDCELHYALDSDDHSSLTQSVAPNKRTKATGVSTSDNNAGSSTMHHHERVPVAHVGKNKQDHNNTYPDKYGPQATHERCESRTSLNNNSTSNSDSDALMRRGSGFVVANKVGSSNLEPSRKMLRRSMVSNNNMSMSNNNIDPATGLTQHSPPALHHADSQHVIRTSAYNNIINTNTSNSNSHSSRLNGSTGTQKDSMQLWDIYEPTATTTTALKSVSNDHNDRLERYSDHDRSMPNNYSDSTMILNYNVADASDVKFVNSAVLQESIAHPEVLLGWQIEVLANKYNAQVAPGVTGLFMITDIKKNLQRKTEFKIMSCDTSKYVELWTKLKRSETKRGLNFLLVEKILHIN